LNLGRKFGDRPRNRPVSEKNGSFFLTVMELGEGVGR
jgi:hypothetical protein